MSSKIEKTIRTFTVQEFLGTNRNYFSELRIRGKWLTEAGFAPDSKVEVKVKRKSLSIRVID